MPNQIFVGITGGIGSGKTFVSGILKNLGFPVYNSDERAKFLTENSPEILSSIKNTFGKEVFDGEQLNRPALAKVVFSGKQLLEQLNQIIHPVVAEDYKKWQALQRSAICFKEAAILFEIGAYKSMDANVLVTANKELRIERVLDRDGGSVSSITDRMERQWSDEKKSELADYILDNSGFKPLVPQIDQLLKYLKSRI